MKVKRSAEHWAAVALLIEIEEHTKKRLLMRDVEEPQWISRRQTECEKAMRMIEAEMLASLQRCAALEGDL